MTWRVFRSNGVKCFPMARIEAGKGYWPEGFNLTGAISDRDARILVSAPKLLDELKSIATWLSAYGIEYQRRSEIEELIDAIECDA